MNNRLRWSAFLMNASMVWYILWLMLPAVQVRLKAVTGGAALMIFALGVLLDWATFKQHWKTFVPRVLCVLALPLLLVLFLHRGSMYKLGYLAQQVMFWFPLVWFAYVRHFQKTTAYRTVFLVMLAAFSVTLLTTIGWLIEGFIHPDGTVVSFSRALASGAVDHNYLNELMKQNIGGYDFVYASVLALPFIFYLAGGKGWKRWGFSALYVLILLLTALSQYTYAMMFAFALTTAELLGLLLRKLFKRMSVGVSLLCSLPFFALLFLLRVPLLSGLISLADSLHLVKISFNLGQLNSVVTGVELTRSSRLTTYLPPLNSFLASPVLGGIFGGEPQLGLHSELLDMLAAIGVIGTAFFLAAVWVIGRGMGKGLKANSAIPHLVLQWIALAALATINTVFYSREIPLMICLCIAFAVWTGREKSGIINETQSRRTRN